MNDFIPNNLPLFGAPEAFSVNLHAVLTIFMALVLGLFVGYERSFRGRAAGMRTYGLVCMSSCALIVLGGHPEMWFDGSFDPKLTDPTRIMQGITTGIGFLGAGVIMRDGLNISGLTTAASIWTVATIGVLVGIGYHEAAIGVALLAAGLMMWGSKIENLLPTRHAVSISLQFHKDADLTEADVAQLMRTQGYMVADGSFSILQQDGRLEWRFVAVSLGGRKSATLVKLGESLKHARGIQDFTLAHARN